MYYSYCSYESTRYLVRHYATITLATFNALNRLVCYMYHHPHLSIMYRYGTHDATLQLYIIKGHAEILDPEKYQGLMVYTDADFARDLNSRISVSINIIEYIGTVIAWGVHKQTVPGTCTNITETKSIYKGVKKTLELRRFLESMNDSISGPILEKDRLTPRIRQLDIVLTWLHYQYIRGIFLPFYIDTKKKKVT